MDKIEVTGCRNIKTISEIRNELELELATPQRMSQGSLDSLTTRIISANLAKVSRVFRGGGAPRPPVS